MKITMLSLMAGPTVLRKAGKTYDVPDKEAKELIAAGYAVAAKPEKGEVAETASRGKRGETAAKPSAKAEGEED
jgi:hypothetical protein